MQMHARSAMLHLERVGAAAHESHAEVCNEMLISRLHVPGPLASPSAVCDLVHVYASVMSLTLRSHGWPQDPQGQQGDSAEASGAPHGIARAEAESAEPQPAADLALQLPGGRTLAAFMGLWDQLTARLLPRNATGASADTLLAAIQLLMAANAAQPSPTQPLQDRQRLLQVAQQHQWQLPHQTSAGSQPAPVQPVPTSDASAAAVRSRDAAAATSDASAQQQGAPVITGQLLAVALQLADLSAAGIPLDAEAIAAGVLAEALVSEQLSMDAVQVGVVLEWACRV